MLVGFYSSLGGNSPFRAALCRKHREHFAYMLLAEALQHESPLSSVATQDLWPVSEIDNLPVSLPTKSSLKQLFLVMSRGSTRFLLFSASLPL